MALPNYWHIQLHPGKDDKSFTIGHLIKALDDGIIGMGSAWDNDGGAPNLFSQSAKIGDIVMIRFKGSPRALVEIISEVFSNDGQEYKGHWFQILRKVRVLCRDGENVKNKFQQDREGNWTQGLFLPITFQSAGGSSFIRRWHGDILRKRQMTSMTELLVSSKNLVLTGPPGTGKTHLARQIAAALQPEAGHTAFVQFHPSYDYTDFVEGLKPADDGKGNIIFRRQDGNFRRFCSEAAVYETSGDGQQETPFVFIIDEINRADLSRVFGELFFALEPSYRGEKGRVRTQYSSLEPGRPDFYVPKNVFIIGTMNDIDRSVDSMDFALRRRFTWHEVDADEARFHAVMHGILEDNPDLKQQALQRYLSLNRAISVVPSLGPHYQIGPAYYRNLELLAEDTAIWASFWDRHLRTLVAEYIRGLPDAPALAVSLRSAYEVPTVGTP